jgi:flagellar L-ring protein precursor FlgH
MRVSATLTILLVSAVAAVAQRPQPSASDTRRPEASVATQEAAGSTAGSLWSPGAPLSDLASDLRAGRVGDLVTILVAERASGFVRGSTQAARKSAADYSVGTLLGKTGATLSSLAGAGGSQQLDGTGETSRENVLTTTLSARVTEVLPNGNLAVEAAKSVTVNSETQLITVRGIIRQFDLGAANIVRSDRIANLEVRINGKGVVGDAIRRPFILYRILLGLLPF